jgi:hypothetical protein
MTINKIIGAPLHEKDVDGINTTRYLLGCMCLIGTPEANDGDKRMVAQSMAETASKSPTDKCAHGCALSRLKIARSEKAHEAC